MNELKFDFDDATREELVYLIKQKDIEIVQLQAVADAYKKHLEQLIEFNSVERYRETVRRNKEVVEHTLQDSEGNIYDPDDECVKDPFGKVETKIDKGHQEEIGELATEISNILFNNKEHFTTVVINEDRFDICKLSRGVPMNRYED